MLKIYPVALDWIEQLEPLIARMPGPIGIWPGSCGGEMRESYAALQVAQRRRLIGALDAGLEDQCQRLIGTLVRLAVPQRR